MSPHTMCVCRDGETSLQLATLGNSITGGDIDSQLFEKWLEIKVSKFIPMSDRIHKTRVMAILCNQERICHYLVWW